MLPKCFRLSRNFGQKLKNQTHYSDIEKDAGGMNNHVESPKRITAKEGTSFLMLLNSLLEKDFGVQTAQRELSTKGYNIPCAILDRWIQKRKSL